MEIRKHFTAKYGKDFISAAVELRPECGVSRNVSVYNFCDLFMIEFWNWNILMLWDSFFQLIEKLSANAPDGQTKIKILTAIAKEHNIKWEPKSFEEVEPKPPEVLLVRLRR